MHSDTVRLRRDQGSISLFVSFIVLSQQVRSGSKRPSPEHRVLIVSDVTRVVLVTSVCTSGYGSGSRGRTQGV